MKQANSIFKKLKLKTVEFLFLAEKLEDPKQVAHRLATCKSNGGEGGCYDEQRETCRHCGCFPEAKTKMLKHFDVDALDVRITHCPLSKWGGKKELEIVNYYREMDGRELLTLNT